MRSRHPHHPLLLLLAMLCLFALALGVCGFGLSAQYEDSYLGELKYKKDRLKEAEGPKIVVIGGSSVPFSLYSPWIEEALPDYSVVDFGLYADLGTLAMLDLARKDIQEGDLVILSPEQEAQALSDYVGGESLWQAMDGAFSLLTELSPRRFEALLSVYPVFAGKKLHYQIFGAPELTGIYVRSSFNAWGDIESPLRPSNILPGGFQPSPQIRFEPSMLSDEFVEEVRHFAQDIQSKGAQVVYHFPPMNADALSPGTTTGMIDDYYDFLSAKLEIPILGNPHHCLLDSGWFYDSNFHLNASGARVYTKMLIEDLKVFLKDTSPTPFPLPALPPRSSAIEQGDDSCEAFFTYQETDQGCILTGLTEEGLLQKELILPTRIQDLPVTGMEPKLLQGLTQLEKLTIQGNLSMLWDGMLEGCLSLKEVYLTERSPSAYSVGDHWMQGTSFRILVPEEALDAYRRSYFWQHYESWLFGYQD